MFVLRLFGGLSISDAEGPLSGRAFQRRRLALLALLSAAPAGTSSRDKLIAYLWPESGDEQARHLLSVTVYELRKALGEEALLSVGDDLRLNSEVIRSDVGEFEEAIAHWDWERAVSLYAGPFLDGFFIAKASEFERWAEGEREQLAHAYAGALEALAEERAAGGDLRGAVEAWRRLAVQDPYNSRVALHLMEALAAAGDRAGAIQHARVHAMLLEEIEVEPDPALTALAEQLREEPAATLPAEQAAERAVQGTAVEAAPARSAKVVSAAPGAPPFPSEVDEAPPVTDGDAGERRRAVPAEEPEPPRAFGRTARRGALAGLIVLVILAGVWAVWTRGIGTQAPSPTIAVIPFVDTSPDAENEYLADGITDELINALAQVEGLRVAARTSSFAFKGKDVSVRTIGEDLGVGTVLEGTVREVGNRLRVTAQLINVADGYTLWARAYERDPRDIFVIEEEIVRAVVNLLRGRTRGESTRLVRSYTDNLEVYHLYLRGRYFWHRRDDPLLREENLRRSVAHFQQALVRDSSYAPAYAGLADSYASLAGILPRDEAYSRASTAARRALELDETLAEAHLALARILVFHEWDWEGAGRAYRGALDLSPGDATARQWYGMYLLHLGRVEEALREIRRAQQLDPLSLSVNNDVGRVLYYARRYGEAIAQFRSTLELEPGSADAHLYLGLAYAEQSSFEQAIAEFQRWGELTRQRPTTLLGYTYAVAGNHGEARRLLAELLEQSERERVSPAGIALIYAQLGNRDRAFEWLEMSLEERSPFLLFLRVSPRLDPLRGDPRFDRLLRQVGLN